MIYRVCHNLFSVQYVAFLYKKLHVLFQATKVEIYDRNSSKCFVIVIQRLSTINFAMGLETLPCFTSIFNVFGHEKQTLPIMPCFDHSMLPVEDNSLSVSVLRNFSAAFSI